eukprot:440474-Pyramimonas_sp.AAC.1
MVAARDHAETAETAQRAWDTLDAAGPQCKGLEVASTEAAFTGLALDDARGRVGLGRRRAWRIRPSTLRVAGRGFASGDALRVLLGHFARGPLTRREL